MTLTPRSIRRSVAAHAPWLTAAAFFISLPALVQAADQGVDRALSKADCPNAGRITWNRDPKAPQAYFFDHLLTKNISGQNDWGSLTDAQRCSLFEQHNPKAWEAYSNFVHLRLDTDPNDASKTMGTDPQDPLGSRIKALEAAKTKIREKEPAILAALGRNPYYHKRLVERVDEIDKMIRAVRATKASKEATGRLDARGGPVKGADQIRKLKTQNAEQQRQNLNTRFEGSRGGQDRGGKRGRRSSNQTPGAAGVGSDKIAPGTMREPGSEYARKMGIKAPPAPEQGKMKPGDATRRDKEILGAETKEKKGFFGRVADFFRDHPIATTLITTVAGAGIGALAGGGKGALIGALAGAALGGGASLLARATEKPEDKDVRVQNRLLAKNEKDILSIDARSDKYLEDVESARKREEQAKKTVEYMEQNNVSDVQGHGLKYWKDERDNAGKRTKELEDPKGKAYKQLMEDQQAREGLFKSRLELQSGLQKNVQVREDTKAVNDIDSQLKKLERQRAADPLHPGKYVAQRDQLLARKKEIIDRHASDTAEAAGSIESEPKLASDQEPKTSQGGAMLPASLRTREQDRQVVGSEGSGGPTLTAKQRARTPYQDTQHIIYMGNEYQPTPEDRVRYEGKATDGEASAGEREWGQAALKELDKPKVGVREKIRAGQLNNCAEKTRIAAKCSKGADLSGKDCSTAAKRLWSPYDCGSDIMSAATWLADHPECENLGSEADHSDSTAFNGCAQLRLGQKRRGR